MFKIFKNRSKAFFSFPKPRRTFDVAFSTSRSNLNNAILIKWIKSLENKSIVDKLVSQGWYLPFNSDYLQSKYKTEMLPISGPSVKCWENSWSFPVLTNEQKINLKNIWNESLSP